MFDTARPAELLSVIFCCLRASGVIDWPWYLVMMPLILAAGGYLLLFLLGLIVVLIRKMRSDGSE